MKQKSIRVIENTDEKVRVKMTNGETKKGKWCVPKADPFLFSMKNEYIVTNTVIDEEKGIV